ncbi:universal stress protein [Jeotgalibacillus sp. ET6]|uniref:universal stress protein n=1 Tax=Jeotgalibacillus sp. ET6 TaxID=3037260 RepID=UPI00241898C1|nr:universal stress protein [Jeotgalibacillus sp. ET6]MDG5473386.1 universal stress protein [Jeotgalibacillus sp. ET6]
MYTHILLAFDQSDSSQKALDSAVELLHLNNKADLTITHVSTEKHSLDTTIYDKPRDASAIMSPGVDRQNPPYMPPLPQQDNGKSVHQLTDELDDALKSAKDHLDNKNIEAQFYPLTGSPAEAIVDYAENNEVDLIIVGRTEKSTFQKWFLGSVSEKIMQSSPCSVLVIK